MPTTSSKENALLSSSEREAMERLAADDYPSLQEFIGDQELALAAALSRHARSKEPITVEGLVAMGFYKEPIEDTKNAYAHPCGLHFDARKNHQSMHILVRRPDPHDNWIDYANPQPQTMLDVDNLIERLSR